MQNIPEHTNCKNCGFCCCVVPITQNEDLAVRAYLAEMDGTTLEDLGKQHRSYDSCQFHDLERKRCAIYPVRPRICRMFGVALGMNCLYGNTSNIDIRRIPEGQSVMLMPDYFPSRRFHDYSVPLAMLSNSRERFEVIACILTTAEVDYKYRSHSDLFQCRVREIMGWTAPRG